MKKEYEFIVDHKFYKEREKVLDKQVAFLKSKGYEMGNSYFDWNKYIGGDNFMLCIDLCLSCESNKCYVYLSDIVVKSTNDIKIIQRALQRVKQDYLEVMNIGGNENGQ